MAKKTKITADLLGTIDKKYSSSNYSEEISNIWIGKKYNQIKTNALIKTVFKMYSGKK